MADLKACLENEGFAGVATYIQSGNVLFQAPREATLDARIERILAKRFGYEARIVLLTRAQLAEVAEGAPRGFGKEPGTYRYDVVFLKAPLTAAEAMESVSVKPGVDKVHPGRRALYTSRLISKATQSRLSRHVSLPVYQHMTIRNWNTTTKLLALMDQP